MYADIQKTCGNPKCGRLFWLRASEQQACHDQKLRPPDRCPGCRTSTSGQISSGLATLEQVRAGSNNTALGPVLPDLSVLFRDVKQLLEQASTPIEYRSRTFWEKVRGLDLEAMQIEQKLRAGNYADQLMRQRLSHIRHVQEIATAMLQDYLEQLKLQEQIAQLKALAEERIKTRQVEEISRQVQLLNPVQPPRPAKKKDLLTEAIEDLRNEVRAKAAAKQAILSDFGKAVQSIFDTELEDTEKAARIRAITEAYNQELEALPRVVREYLERVERGEYDTGEEDDDEDDEDEEGERDDADDDEDYEDEDY